MLTNGHMWGLGDGSAVEGKGGIGGKGVESTATTLGLLNWGVDNWGDGDCRAGDVADAIALINEFTAALSSEAFG